MLLAQMAEEADSSICPSLATISLSSELWQEMIH